MSNSIIGSALYILVPQALVCRTVFHRSSLPPPPLCIFCCRLKSHLFSLSYPAFWLFSHLYSARAVTQVIFDTLVAITIHFTFSKRQLWALAY